MDETTAPGSPHELLLRLAGRVDDDLLADARELVAVGEDGHALERVTAALAADGTPLPPSVRAELVSVARAARIDLDAEAALAPAASDAVAHRFTAQASEDESVVAAVRQLPSRLRDGVRLRLAWRLTPAGSAPGPLPHPVLLVETPEGGRPGEVLAYQMAVALGRSGVHAAVEVLTSGRPMPAYHAAALRDSTPLDDGTPTLSPRAAPSPPEVVDSVVAEVVEEVTAGRRTAGVRSEAPQVERAEAASEAPVDLFAADDEPAPRPVPMRTWPGGRRRRAFGEDQEQPDEQSVTSIARAPLPSPVPLARRTRPGPGARPGDDTPFAAPTFEAATGPSDPLVGPLRQPLLDPLLEPGSPQQTEHDESGWASEWASGDWAVGAPVDGPDDPDTPVSGMAPVAPIGPASPVPSSASDGLFTAGGPGPAPQAGAEPGLLKPESLARLSDADRELLARLQAELVAGRSGGAPNGNGAGAHALREPSPHEGGGPGQDGPGAGGPEANGAGGPRMGDPQSSAPRPGAGDPNAGHSGVPETGGANAAVPRPDAPGSNGGGPGAGVSGAGDHVQAPNGSGAHDTGPYGAGGSDPGASGPAVGNGGLSVGGAVGYPDGGGRLGPVAAGGYEAGPNGAGPAGPHRPADPPDLAG